jgi:translation initiation factor 3 subunit A
MKPEEKATLASSVVLATLAVPNIKDISSTPAMNEDEEVQTIDKSVQLATLLNFLANPSRKLLLDEIVNLGLLDEVLPEFKGLYEALECKFFPLKLISTIISGLHAIRVNPAVKQYADQLEKVAMIRVLQQLSKVSKTIKLDFLYKLFQPLQTFSVAFVERVLLEAVANKQLNLRISHAQGTITFITALSSVTDLDTQVAKLGSALNKVARAIESITIPNHAGTQATDRRAYFSAIAEIDEK